MNPSQTCDANAPTENSIRVYNVAKECLNTSLVPKGDDIELGCAISVTVILKEMCSVGINETLSTNELLQELKNSTLFKEVFVPVYGDIIISATGTSTLPKTPIKNGHVGIVARHGILSNNSLTGLWDEFYTLESWISRYQTKGGYPTRYFRLL